MDLRPHPPVKSGLRRARKAAMPSLESAIASIQKLLEIVEFRLRKPSALAII